MNYNKEWFFDLFNVTEKHIGDYSYLNNILYSKDSSKGFQVGELKVYSLDEIEKEARLVLKDMKEIFKDKGFNVSVVRKKDVYKMHSNSSNKDALFQISGTFDGLQNEKIITDYINNYTYSYQSSIATVPSTVYRKYFSDKLNLIEGLEKDSRISKKYWNINDGNLILKEDTATIKIDDLNKVLEDNNDKMRDLIKVGYHDNIEVVYSSKDKLMNQDLFKYNVQSVSHSLCSPLDLKLNLKIDKNKLLTLSQLILEAQYEATLWMGVLNAYKKKNNKVILVVLGFLELNNIKMIVNSLFRAISIFKNKNIPLDITINLDTNNDAEENIFYDFFKDKFKEYKSNDKVLVPGQKISKSVKTNFNRKKTKKFRTPAKEKQEENRKNIKEEIKDLKKIIKKFKYNSINSKSSYSKRLKNSLINIDDTIKKMNHEISK